MSAQQKKPQITALSSPRKGGYYREDPVVISYTSDGKVRVAVNPSETVTARDRDTDLYMTSEAMEQHAAAARAYQRNRESLHQSIRTQAVTNTLLWLDQWIAQHTPADTPELSYAHVRIRQAIEDLKAPMPITESHDLR